MTQALLFATTRRRYPLPENYPVDPSLIPDMPIEMFHLATTGRITPDDRTTYGFPEMSCASCDQETTLLLNRAPIAPEAYKTAKRKLSDTGLVWGTDVSVICPCCSFSACPHCWWHGELVIGHEPNADGTCTRCGKKGCAR